MMTSELAALIHIAIPSKVKLLECFLLVCATICSAVIVPEAEAKIKNGAQTRRKVLRKAGHKEHSSLTYVLAS